MPSLCNNQIIFYAHSSVNYYFGLFSLLFSCNQYAYYIGRYLGSNKNEDR